MAITPLMNLTLPDVGVTPGPTWATLLNSALTVVDSHDHSPGSGSRIPTAGLNINADLEFNGFNLTEVLAAVFESQSGTLGPSLINRLYVVGNEIYFNDGIGNAVKLTNAGAVNVSGSNGIGGDYGGGNPAALNFVEATSTFEFYENPSGPNRAHIKFAGFDMNSRAAIASATLAGNLTITATDATFVLLVDTSAGRTITLPDPTLGNRFFIIKDKTGTSQTNPIILARNAAETIDGVAASKTLSKNFGIWYVLSDGTNWWVLKDDVAPPVDQTSYTVFEGPFSAGSDTIPTAFASPTLSDANFTDGTPVTRSTNTLTFPFVGKYEITMVLPNLVASSATRDCLVRLRNTTDATTTASSNGCTARSTAANADTNIMIMKANITDIAKGFEVQWMSDAATSTVTSNTVGGETPSRWTIIIKKIKDEG